MQTDNTSKEMCHSGEQFIPESLTDISSAWLVQHCDFHPILQVWLSWDHNACWQCLLLQLQFQLLLIKKMSLVPCWNVTASTTVHKASVNFTCWGRRDWSVVMQGSCCRKKSSWNIFSIYPSFKCMS
jgi:hypothetical protein